MEETNCFALELAHIGEALVAKLLCNDAIRKNLKDLVKEKIKIPDSFVAIANKSIDNYSDPMHRVDVLISDGKNLTAIEVKFGTSIVTPGGYCANYLSNASNGNKGNMINKLIEGRLLVDEVNVNREWILLVRNGEIKGKLQTPTRLGAANQSLWNNMLNTCTIISLEDLLVGVETDVFESAVQNCLNPQQSFHEDWKISIRPSNL